MIIEEFKPIAGYNGNYLISNLGTVKSVNRLAWNGYKNHTLNGRPLKPCISKVGYEMVTLSFNCKTKSHYVHRLVAETFIKNKENKRTINHIDGNKLNNTLENLEWNTDLENVNHAIKKGFWVNKFVSVIQKTISGDFIEKHTSLKDAQIKTGVSFKNISSVINGKSKTAGGFIWSV